MPLWAAFWETTELMLKTLSNPTWSLCRESASGNLCCATHFSRTWWLYPSFIELTVWWAARVVLLVLAGSVDFCWFSLWVCSELESQQVAGRSRIASLLCPAVDWLLAGGWLTVVLLPLVSYFPEG